MAAFEVEEMKQILAGAINRLADREKIVLSLYYYEGLTLAEIGQVLGVTESRVCQIHTKAVLQLARPHVGARQGDGLGGCPDPSARIRLPGSVCRDLLLIAGGGPGLARRTRLCLAGPACRLNGGLVGRGHSP